MFLIVFLSLVICFIFIKIYFKLTSSWCKCRTCLVGKTAIVTGSNTGLGFETAMELATRGARVILAGRNEEKLLEARDQIIKETDNQNVVVRLIDMSSFDSVRKFAKEILSTEDKLHILCNNAGVGGLKHKISIDGQQILMQINYYSSFLLTNLLIDLLKESAPSRIVNVASLGASYAKHFDVDNLNNFPGIMQNYYNTKLCNILFTQECARRLKGTSVTTYSVHPGVVMTNIFKRLQGVRNKIINFFGDIYFKDARSGAQTIIHTCVSKNIDQYSGGHFTECRYQKPYKTAQDPTLSTRLWNSTIKTLKLSPEEVRI